MPALDDILREKLALLDSHHQRRSLTVTMPSSSVEVQRGGKTLISFSGNDYFGLSQHPDVIAAAIKATEQYGTGAGASRLVTGNHPLYAPLEKQLAEVKGTEKACIFGSGYLTSLSVIPALVGKPDLILADRLIHACMIDASLLSGATFMRFAHNNVEHCRMLLESTRSEHQHCLILTETVFSMDGDATPIAELAALAKEHNAWLMTDDAHGLGTHHSVHADIHMGTLSKGLGSYGGYVAASATVIDYITTSARSLIYSTGLPPATLAAASAALRILKRDKALAQKPLTMAKQFTSSLHLPEAQSPIVPLVIGASDKALAASKQLEDAGFLVTAIRPPTVPKDTARLRFTFSSLHNETQVEQLANAVRKYISA